MSNTFVFAGGSTKRLDVFGAECTGMSRSRIAALISEGLVKVNGKVASKSIKLNAGDEVAVILPETKPYTAAAQDIPLDIVYEDSDLLVVNKPKGMVVHPAAGNYQNTLVNALLYHCKDSLSGIGGIMRPGILHRIDKNTSGLLLVAKNDYAHNFLASQIKEHTLDREYEAVVYGNIKDDEGTVDAPIGRHPTKRKQMAVTDKNSKCAVTHFKVLERFGSFTHIRCRLETGRTHQIRVHMSYIGHPLAGDEVYGPKKAIKSLYGQCLHAKRIGFIHPKTNKKLVFENDLPDYFIKFLEVCRKNGSV